MNGTPAPSPLVDLEVDLRDFSFMPLDVLRLRDSELASVPDAEVFRCAVLSWCVAWHQVPAASLPDDDAQLARLLGFGRDLRGFAKIRRAGGLRGWVLCSDGRLYHPVVADKAREAWRGKLAQRWRTEASRVKKHNQRHELEGAAAVRMPEFDDWIAAGCPQGHPLPVPGTSPKCPQGHDAGVPREKHSKGQGEGQGQGQGDLERGNTATSDEVASARPPAEQPPPGAQLTLVDPPADPRPGPYTPPDCPHLKVLALWAEVLPQMPQHIPAQWKGTRADHLRARWRETATDRRWPDQAAGLKYLRKLFAWCAQSPFLMGQVKPQQGRRPFVFELEWLVAPTNWAHVIEGRYHHEKEAA